MFLLKIKTFFRNCVFCQKNLFRLLFHFFSNISKPVLFFAHHTPKNTPPTYPYSIFLLCYPPHMLACVRPPVYTFIFTNNPPLVLFRVYFFVRFFVESKVVLFHFVFCSYQNYIFAQGKKLPTIFWVISPSNFPFL